jgi:hypothetical protein
MATFADGPISIAVSTFAPPNYSIYFENIDFNVPEKDSLSRKLGK